MPPRSNPTIDLLLAQAQRKMTELKELQFFGGDSLNLRRWSQQITVAGDSTPHCWRLRITPEDAETMMPFEVGIKPHTADYTQVIGGQVESVHRTDDIFEYLIIAGVNYGGVPRGFKLQVEYSGIATFNLVQIG